MKVAIYCALALASVVVIGLVSYYGGIIGNNVQANYNKRVVTSKIKQNINTPAFAQGQYESFFNLCAAVQTAETSLDQQYAQLADATTADDKTRVNINIGGIIATRADAVNTYNAQAGEYTRGRFLASNLPPRLRLAYTKGDHTTCAA